MSNELSWGDEQSLAVATLGYARAPTELPPDIVDNVGWRRERTPLPICIGFGVSRPEHVKLLRPVADGVIVGSELEDGVYVISDMVEKPDPDEAPSNLAIIGRYILTPDIFDVIRNTPPGRNGEVQITDALQTQATKNMVLAYRFKGQRFDCGSVEGFVAATNYFFERWKEANG